MHDFDVKMPTDCTFSEERKESTTNSFLSISELESGPQEINSWKIRLHLTFQRIGIKATKFDETRIYFKSDVFSIVPVVDAKAPF